MSDPARTTPDDQHGRRSAGHRLGALCAIALLLAPMSPIHAQVARSITNGGFEGNDPAGNPGTQIFTSAAVAGWDSTVNEIELWDTNFNSVPSHSGNVHAELNANSTNTYYQNVCLANGEALRWSFAHRPRVGGTSPPTQTVNFQVANSGGTVLQTLTTQIATTTVNAWTVNSNTTGLTYTGASGLQRVQFSTPDAGGVGNYLDSVGLDVVPYIELGAVASGAENISSANVPQLLVSGNIASAFTVPVTVTGGTATRGTDYTTPGGGATFNVTIPAGNYIQQAIPLGIAIVNDAEREFDETIDLSVGTSPNWIISGTTTCNTAGRSATTYTIANDDARAAGTPPTLTCPVGTTTFDWDTKTWTDGSLNNDIAQTNIGTITFAITNPNGVFGNNATFGGQTPGLSNNITGGLSPAQLSLVQLVDMTSQNARATTTLTLPTAVPGAQFRIFDIDFNASQFSDLITVTGSFGGAAVTPVLTNGIANLVTGNTAIGDQTAVDNTADGNVSVTFSTPVDTITIAYGNHTTAPADPGQQAMGIHDFTFCNPQANPASTKTSSIVSDPINGTTDPKFIPGAIIRYCILVSNAGSGTMQPATITDPLPATLTYVAGSMLSGTSCTGATTVEDDNNAGADETDPFGASFAGTTATAAAPRLRPGEAIAFVFNATVN